MDITKLTLEQLKVLAYDVLVDQQRMQNSLILINQEIQKRNGINGPINSSKDTLKKHTTKE